MAPPLEFDLDKYLRVSKKVDLSGLAWDRIKDHPVSVGEARTIAYMMDIESHTIIFLRDLLATRAAFEPDVTAFLSCWVYEELWHGEAFSRFLGEAGYRLAPDREPVRADTAYPSRRARVSWIRRRLTGKGYASHVASMAGSLLVKDFVALHMTWGAVNELITLSAYHRIIDRTEHPVLVDLLSRIIKDERRHFKQAQKVVRWALEHLWAPVGTGVRPQEETDFAVCYVFGDQAGQKAAGEMDRTLGELPGLAGITVNRDALRGAMTRMRRSPTTSATGGHMATPLAAFRA